MRKEAKEQDSKEEEHMDQFQEHLEEGSSVKKEDSMVQQAKDSKDFVTIAEDLDIVQAIAQRKGKEKEKECTM